MADLKTNEDAFKTFMGDSGLEGTDTFNGEEFLKNFETWVNNTLAPSVNERGKLTTGNVTALNVTTVGGKGGGTFLNVTFSGKTMTVKLS